MLWLIDSEPPHAILPADLVTSLTVTAIAAGLMDPPDPQVKPTLGLPTAQIIDLEAVRQGGSYD